MKRLFNSLGLLIGKRSNFLSLFNTAMVEAGMAYHYKRYSGNCESAENLGWAEKIAREEKLGIWKGNPQPPWEFRRKAKK